MTESTSATNEVTLNAIDVGPVDFVLKCTKGIFKERFIFCNHTVAGEIFGSDKDNKNLTMYIEDAGLSPQHAQIQFNEETFQYFLWDCGSETGTWLKCRRTRSVEIDVGQVIEVGEGDDVIRLSIEENTDGDHVLEWLRMYQIACIRDRIPGAQLADVREFLKSAEASNLDMSAIEDGTQKWKRAVAEFERLFPLQEGEPKSLAVVDPSRNVRVNTWWDGATVHLADASESECREAAVMYPGGTPNANIRVVFNSGRFYVHLEPTAVSGAAQDLPVVYVRLGARPHWVHPDDAFRIGALEFSVLRFNAGLSCMQGCRPTMEDAEVCIHDLGVSNFRLCSFFAVYDGHAGRECVNFVRAHLHDIFTHKLRKRALDGLRCVRQDITESLYEAFLDTDAKFLKNCSAPPGQQSTSGCAAVVVLSIGDSIWCANVGDCRAVLSRGGMAVDLSSDHRPEREDELQRVVAAGGFISFNRILGRLAVSRAFGDSEYKMCEGSVNSTVGPLVVCEPEIREDKLQEHDEFVLLACDGIFDVFTSQEAVDFVRTELASMPPQEQNPQSVAEKLTYTAIHHKNSKDNVTAVIVTFKRNIEMKELGPPIEAIEAAD